MAECFRPVFLLRVNPCGTVDVLVRQAAGLLEEAWQAACATAPGTNIDLLVEALACCTQWLGEGE